MSTLPLVAIIGRPNTGKSTLFNALVRRRIAIVSEVPGTTRDHIARTVRGEAVDFLLIDTGGMGGGSEDKDFEDDVQAQSLLALSAADLIIFTVNGREEITASDREIASLLRKRSRRNVPVLLVITKCDNPDIAEEAEHAFHELGLGENVLTVSAVHRLGTDAVQSSIERILKKRHFQKVADVAPSSELAVPRIAILGKPNVGKSSLINALMSDAERKVSPRLVSPIPGTTRDTTDVVIRHEESEFLFVDTAGLKKREKSERGLEGLAVLRALQALEDADIAVIVMDASQPLSKQDKHITGLAMDEGKGIIFVLNKIDLLAKDARAEKVTEVSRAFPFCRFAPLLGTSALTRENLPKIFNLISMVHRNRVRRLPVKELQRWLMDQLYGKPLGGLATAKHVTQAKDVPPTFVLFVRNPKQVKVSQLRYLENRLRETFDFAGTTVRWITKGPRDR